MTAALAPPDLTRPVLRWHGGKWRLAPWIIAHFPPHRVYVEPFGGAASVLLRKPRVMGREIYNDLDGEVVGLFRVLQDPAEAERLIRLLELTPFARAEFEISYLPSEDAVERARRLIIRSFMGFGSNAHASTGERPSTGFRANSARSHTTPAHDWRNYPGVLPAVIDRLRGVTLERREAAQVMAAHDAVDALHYVDPPYLHETRGLGNKYDPKHLYRHELDRGGHVRLLDFLRGLAGMVVLSGYPAPLYDEALSDWRRVERLAFADGARERTEVLWLNPACAAALDRAAGGCGAPLFRDLVA